MNGYYMKQILLHLIGNHYISFMHHVVFCRGISSYHVMSHSTLLSSEIRRPISARAPPGAAQAVAAAQMSGGVVGTIDGIETGSLLLSRIRPQSEFARLKATGKHCGYHCYVHLLCNITC